MFSKLNNKILVIIKENLQKEKPNKWEIFYSQFQKLHPDFFTSLKNINNTLSSNEMRHCAFIKMNLTTKEISEFLGVTERTVQTTRYRIKKKLNLGYEKNLFDFIKKI